jgi:hypothetical protein
MLSSYIVVHSGDWERANPPNLRMVCKTPAPMARCETLTA